jgi:hypothetical protein
MRDNKEETGQVSAQLLKWLACGLMFAIVNIAFAASESEPFGMREALMAVECLHRSDASAFQGTFRSIGDPFGVAGTHYASSPVFITSKLSFGTEAQFVFDQYLSMERDQCKDFYYVVADEITIVEPGATILWETTGVIESPFGRGSAPAGASGSGKGESGVDGTKGAPGNAGFNGTNAPTLVLLTRSIGGKGKLRLEFRGGNGGTGGAGQNGGDGGAGRQGRPAVASMLGCKREAGRGGNGGNGGAGGPGGTGGNGGVGGTVILITSHNGAEAANELILMDVKGGAGGLGGPGGVGGRPGPGGSEGAPSPPHCRPANRNGVEGKRGDPGTEGKDGTAGGSGDHYVIPLSSGELKAVMRGPKKR